MGGRDVYRFVNELDEKTVQGLVNRLEFRAKDAAFVRLRDAYFEKLPLASSGAVLDIGCGTGVIGRALAKRPGFSGRVLGVDQSPALIDAARRLAAEEGVGEHVEFQVGDVHALDYPKASFDIVIAHTLLSHVTDPLAVLKEAARVTRPGSVVTIFDGDYASLTFAHPDPAFAKAVDEALISAVVNNPRVMRDLPRLAHEAGLKLTETIAHNYAEVGTGSFFANLAEAYAPLITRSGLLPADQVELWIGQQRRSVQDGTFFAACNYYAYLTLRL